MVASVYDMGAIMLMLKQEGLQDQHILGIIRSAPEVMIQPLPRAALPHYDKRCSTIGTVVWQAQDCDVVPRYDALHTLSLLWF